MLIESYYVILPTQQLKYLLKTRYPTEYEFFGRPYIWRHSTGCFGSIWQEEDVHRELKLLFLMDLYSRFGDSHNSEMRALIGQLYGQPPFTLDVFDKWWVLEEVLGSNSTEDALETIKVEEMQLFGKTDSPVDELIEELIAQRLKEA